MSPNPETNPYNDGTIGEADKQIDYYTLLWPKIRTVGLALKFLQENDIYFLSNPGDDDQTSPLFDAVNNAEQSNSHITSQIQDLGLDISQIQSIFDQIQNESPGFTPIESPAATSAFLELSPPSATLELADQILTILDHRQSPEILRVSLGLISSNLDSQKSGLFRTYLMDLSGVQKATDFLDNFRHILTQNPDQLPEFASQALPYAEAVTTFAAWEIDHRNLTAAMSAIAQEPYLDHTQQLETVLEYVESMSKYPQVRADLIEQLNQAAQLPDFWDEYQKYVTENIDSGTGHFRIGRKHLPSLSPTRPI